LPKAIREDLYYRLTSSTCWVPPLARCAASEFRSWPVTFVERYAKLYRRDGFSIPLSVVERLTPSRYPGNVASSRNLIHALIVSDASVLIRIPLSDAGANGGRSLAPSLARWSRARAQEPSLKEISRRASQAASASDFQDARTDGWNRSGGPGVRISYTSSALQDQQAGSTWSEGSGALAL